MENVDNLEVKEYIKENVSKILDGCELFSKTFGRGFAKRKMEDLEGVYTTKSNSLDGEYNYSQKIIRLYSKQEELNPYDIEENEDMRLITLHEGTHAVLLRTFVECLRYNICAGTGILAELPNGKIVGRGLGEGYVNWILEKAGTPINFYKNLTNLFKILELAIGSEKIMKLGTGNPRTNPRRQLNMTEREWRNFTEETDEIYFLEQKARTMTGIANIMIRYQDKDRNSEEIQKIQEDFANLQNKEEYMVIFSSREYQEELKYKGTEDTIEERIDFLEEEVKYARAEAVQAVGELIEEIFIKYFREETERVVKSGRVHENEFLEIKRLYELIAETMNTDEKYKIDVQYVMPEVQRILNNNYKHLEKEYVLGEVRNISARAAKQEEFRNGIKDMSKYDNMNNTKRGIKSRNTRQKRIEMPFRQGDR